MNNKLYIKSNTRHSLMWKFMLGKIHIFFAYTFSTLFSFFAKKKEILREIIFFFLIPFSMMFIYIEWWINNHVCVTWIWKGEKKVVSLLESFSLIVITALFFLFFCREKVSIYTNINRPYAELTPQTCDSHVWDSSFFLNSNCFFTQQQIVKQYKHKFTNMSRTKDTHFATSQLLPTFIMNLDLNEK